MIKRSLTMLAVISTLVFLMAPIAGAVPLLQLYIQDGYYDMVTETIVTAEDNFVLSALLTPNGVIIDENGNEVQADSRIDWLSLPYYISIALIPSDITEHTDLGSIEFGGETISVTGDMEFGNPPLDEYLATKGLPPHGIFDTFYYETDPGFMFTSTNVTQTFNTQDAAMDGVITPLSGYSYIYTWEVDVSNLAGEYNVHFDLYNLYSQVDIEKKNGDIMTKDIKVFAPFSHDAQTVPEPGTLVLLGIGLLGVAAYRRKMK